MTLRLRLTLFYTALLGAALIIFSAILYVLLRNSLTNELDRVLISSALEVEKRVAATLTAERSPVGAAVFTVDTQPIREFTTPGIYIQILDETGRIVDSSLNLAGEALPINPDLAQAALAGDATLSSTNPGQPALPLRILNKPLVIRGQVWGVLQVGASLYHLYLTMRSMLTLLTVGLLGTLVIGAGGIWFLTRRALRPLDAIAHTAEYIGSSQDLSQRLRELGPNDEVGRLTRAFNAMIGRLGAAFSAQKQFIADSSHELRTPLTVIRGNLDLLKRDPSPENKHESLTAIEQETMRMGKIVDDLMLLAQLDAAQSPQRRPVALDEVVMHVYNQTRVLAIDRTVALSHVDAVTVLAEHDRLVQMLLNLVDNAIKYTPAGGTITIACHAPERARHPGLAKLSVSDTGIGIAPEHLPHLFDRFYRIDRGRSRAQGGTGLGLAITKSIAETYGGRITVDSTPGQGSTFAVLLPAVDS